jgi:acyl-coenzyme A synthetase/AMP-(fatty) acid ligase
MTSGSTAEPKLLPSRGRLYLDVLHGRSDPTEPAPHDVLMGAFAHVGVGLYLPLMAALLGAPLWAFDPSRIAPAAILPRAAEFGATYWLTVPSLLRRLLAVGRPDHPVPSLRMLATSGEALHGEDVDAIRALLGPDVTIAQRYGATEVGPIARHLIGPGELAPSGPLPAGRARDGLTLAIVDDDERPVPPGTVGRIRVDGRLSAISDAAVDLGDGRQRLVLSDLGTIGEDGLLRLTGRQDRMVKVGGVRVEPGAVEDVLRRVPGVREVAVVPVAIPGGEHRLVAHVVVDVPGGVAPEVLRAAARAALSSMAVPARFVIGTDPLPLLANGKLDRRSLVERSGTGSITTRR